MISETKATFCSRWRLEDWCDRKKTNGQTGTLCRRERCRAPTQQTETLPHEKTVRFAQTRLKSAPSTAHSSPPSEPYPDPVFYSSDPGPLRGRRRGGDQVNGLPVVVGTQGKKKSRRVHVLRDFWAAATPPPPPVIDLPRDQMGHLFFAAGAGAGCSLLFLIIHGRRLWGSAALQLLERRENRKERREEKCALGRFLFYYCFILMRRKCLCGAPNGTITSSKCRLPHKSSL